MMQALAMYLYSRAGGLLHWQDWCARRGVPLWAAPLAHVSADSCSTHCAASTTSCICRATNTEKEVPPTATPTLTFDQWI